MTDDFLSPPNPLDDCLDAIYDQGQTAADCLDQHPEQREALEPLLGLTGRLQAARHLTPSPDFQMSARARLEQRLAASPRASTAAAAYAEPVIPAPGPESPAHAVETHPTPVSPWPTQAPRRQPGVHHNGARHPGARLPDARPAGRRPAWALAAVLALAIMILLINTTVSLANRALPGDPFYPVKLAAENAQRALAPLPAQDAGLEITFTDQRFQEMKTALVAGQAGQAAQAANQYADQLQTTYTYTGSSLLTPAQKAQVTERLAAELARHEQELTGLASGSPAQIQTVVTGALETIHDLYATLYKAYPNLPPPDRHFIALPTANPTALSGQTTPSPRPTQPRLATARAGQPEEPEWPTTWPSAWPTQWTTEWATLLPTGYATQIPPVVETFIATVWPTYIPTDILGKLPIPTVLPIDPQQWPTLPAGENWPPVEPPDPGGFPQPPDGFTWPP